MKYFLEENYDHLINSLQEISIQLDLEEQNDGSFHTCIGDNRLEKEKYMNLKQVVNQSLIHLKYAYSEISYLIYHDSITGSPNRRKFKEDMLLFLEKAKRMGQKLCIYFVNIDRFKHINDSLGHTVGDIVLKVIADRWVTNLSGDAIIYKFTGDQFIIIFPNQPDDSLVDGNGKRILSVFDKPIQINNVLSLPTTGCIGISTYPYHGTDVDSLVKKAEIAVKVSKSQGKNTFRTYEQKMKTNYEEYLLIETHLPFALKNNEFELYFQPKLCLATGSITGMEALIRWIHPILGSVPPNKFIPIAEDTGLIIQLDEWVLKHACLQNKKWNDVEKSPLRVSVNISPLHFRHPHFLKMVERVIEETGIDPLLLELEITEGALLENTEESINYIIGLRKMGVIVSIDDFGTGYSSLIYLKRFPINVLKIDQSFVKEIVKNKEDIAIVKAIIYLAHEMRLKVVAEGVEEKEALDYLRLLGCDEVQGYYVSKPMPALEFEKFLTMS